MGRYERLRTVNIYTMITIKVVPGTDFVEVDLTTLKAYLTSVGQENHQYPWKFCTPVDGLSYQVNHDGSSIKITNEHDHMDLSFGLVSDINGITSFSSASGYYDAITAMVQSIKSSAINVSVV
jgi:hypothetical protein